MKYDIVNRSADKARIMPLETGPAAAVVFYRPTFVMVNKFQAKLTIHGELIDYHCITHTERERERGNAVPHSVSLVLYLLRRRL